MRVYLGKDPLTDKPRWATDTCEADTKKAAQLLCDEYAKTVKGGALDARKATVKDLLERWFEFGVQRELWSPGTELKHREFIDTRYKPLWDKRLSQLRTIDLDDFYGALRSHGGRNRTPLAGATVIRVAGPLKLALDQAVRWGLIAVNPAIAAQPGKQQKRKAKAPKDDAVKALLVAALAHDPELFCYLFLDAQCGARRGEICALRLSDFTDDGTVIVARAITVGLESEANAARFAGHYWPSRWGRGTRRTALIEKAPKTEDSEREISLSPATAELVAEQVARLRARARFAGVDYPDDGFLFPDPIMPGTKPLRPDTWTARVGDLRATYKIKGRVWLHGLRHFVATELLAAGIDLPTVAMLLGHGGGGKTTIAVYGHGTTASARRATDVMAALLPVERKPSEDAEIVPMRRRAT